MSSNLVRFDPFAEMRALQKQFFGDDWFTSGSMPQLQIATTDVYTEDDNKLVVEAHLPHFSDKDINVQIDKGDLVVQAEKREREEDKKKKYVVRESSSSFYRRIRLPEQADAENIEAHMDDGVLKVTVPFRELPEPKKIEIKKTSKKLEAK